MRGIFISYRRDDAEGQAGRLFDDLSAHFGPDAVFMDVAGIKKGLDFRRIIDEHVTSCGVLLVIIGKRWLEVTDSKGNRRLDDPNDFVRLETAAALSRDIPVVPVLVHDAAMPTEQDLPDALKELAFRNGTELTHARWESDVKLLIEDLRPYLDLSPAARATPSIQPTRERSVVADTGTPSAGWSASGRSLWVTAGAVVIASGVSIAGYHYWPDPQSAQGVALAATQNQAVINEPRKPEGTAAAPTAAVPATAAPPRAAGPLPKVVEEPAMADPSAAAEAEAERIASERAAAATVAAARAATARANAEAAARAAAARKDAQERREREEAQRATQLAAEQRKRDEENQRLLVAQAEKSRLAAEQAEKNRIAAEQAAAAKIFTDIAGAFINSRGNRR